jgi:outer membrane protein OmpA-like peptidoglycan-associated protein
MKYLLILISLIFVSSPIDARNTKNVDYAGLEKDYNNLIENEKYKPYAKLEKKIAKESASLLLNGKVKRKKRELALYLSKHNIAYARLVAEYQWIEDQIKTEQEIAHNFEVAISKTQAEIARHDAEIARMMLIAQQEEAQRANERANQAELETQNSKEQQAILQQETQAAKRYAKAQAEEAELAKQEAELALEEADSLRKKLNSIVTQKTDKGLMMTLGDFVFDSSKATIKQDAVDNFTKVVQFINTYPDNNVRIEGHTDSSGSNQLNLRLSQQRADAVKALLIKNGIKSNQIESIGMGEDFPIAENSSSAGKAKNRRVEIIILQ